jgi:hypothetical protein
VIFLRASKEEAFKNDNEKCSLNSTVPKCEYFYQYYKNASNYTVDNELIIPDRSDEFLIYLSNFYLS